MDAINYQICGNSVAKAPDGMATTIHVVPAVGAGWFAVYFHSDEVKKLRDNSFTMMAERDLWKKRALEYGERLAREAFDRVYTTQTESK